MDATATPDAAELARLRTLADSLGCLCEQDLALLYGVAGTTLQAWRKRGAGPAYILAGVNYLYRKSDVAADLEARVRARGTSATRELL